MKHMALHQDKAKFMLKKTPDITEDIHSQKALRVLTDNSPSWALHVNTSRKKTSTEVFQIYRIKHFVNFQTKELFFTAQIESLINYASTLWDSATKNTLTPLHSLHRQALKLILQQYSLDQDD